MKLLIIPIALLLAGCVTAPVKHSFPRPPEVITEKCAYLNEVAENEQQLSEFLKVISKNYTLYHECATKHELLVKWIREQVEIHDAVFNKGK